jgi:UDP-glucose 4-epimerase
MVRKMTDSASEIVLVPYSEAYEEGFEDMRRRLPDLGKVERLIGYRPTLDLPELLTHIIAYEKERLATGGSRQKREPISNEALFSYA